MCMLGGNKWMLVPVFLDLKNWVFRLTWGSLTSQKHKDHYLPHYGTHQCFSFLFANSLNWKWFGTTFDTTYWYKILVQHWNIGTTYTICIVLKCTMYNVIENFTNFDIWPKHLTFTQQLFCYLLTFIHSWRYIRDPCKAVTTTYYLLSEGRRSFRTPDKPQMRKRT